MLVNSSKEAIELLGHRHPKLEIKLYRAHSSAKVLERLRGFPMRNGQRGAHVLHSAGQCWVKQHSQAWSLPFNPVSSGPMSFGPDV